RIAAAAAAAAAAPAPTGWKGGQQQRGASSWGASAAPINVAGSMPSYAPYGYAQPLAGSFAAPPAAVSGWHAVPAMVPQPAALIPAFSSAPAAQAAWSGASAPPSGWGKQQAAVAMVGPRASSAAATGETGVAGRPARRVCAYFKRGNCKYGSQCKQSHDLSQGPPRNDGGALAQSGVGGVAWPTWGGTAGMEEEMYDMDAGPPPPPVPTVSLDMLVGMQAAGSVPTPVSAVTSASSALAAAHGATVGGAGSSSHAAAAAHDTLAVLFAAADFVLGSVPMEPPPQELCTPVPLPR
ncbi:MAG: hypothetical protein EOO41_03320, partial [Methanobacteriota archaeon]